MADWVTPVLSSFYDDFLDYLKARDVDAAQLFDGVGSNLPVNTIRWSSANKRFEKFDGTNWNPLVDQYNINVAQLMGKIVDDNATDTSALWTASKIISQINTRADTSLSNVSDSVILTKIKNVDGAGSGLDADLLDGLNSTAFARKDIDDVISGKLRFTNTADVSLSTNGAITIGQDSGVNLTIDANEIMARNNGTNSPLYLNSEGGDVHVNNQAQNAGDLYVKNSRVLTTADEGSGNGLDADTVDGLNATDFTRNNAVTLGYAWLRKNGDIPFFATRGGNSAGNIAQFHWSQNNDDPGDVRIAAYATATASALRVYNATDGGKRFYIAVDGNINILNAYDYTVGAPIDFQIGYDNTQTINIPAVVDFGVEPKINGEAAFTRANTNGTIGRATGVTAMYVNADPSTNRWILAPRLSDDSGWDWGHEYYFDTVNRAWGWDNTPFVSPDNGTTRYYVWHSGNDGSGSGLDADTLDGKHANEIGQLAGGSTAIGYQALLNDDSTDNYNTAFGYYAGKSITSGYHNVIVGAFAADDATIGYNSVIIGSNAAGGGTSVGGGNVAIGKYSGYSFDNFPTYNTLVGGSSGRSITSGDNNTCIGESAGFYITTGQNNTCLGSGAGSDTSPLNITTESNRIVLGDNNVTNAYIKVSWTVTSDKRDKTDIKDIPYGLDFISKLKPREFKFDDRSRYWKPIYDENGEIIDYDKTHKPDGSKKDKRPLWGFIAQEVLEIQEELGIIDSPVVDTANPDKYALKETSLIPVLVNAIKELKSELDEVKKELKKLKEECCK